MPPGLIDDVLLDREFGFESPLIAVVDIFDLNNHESALRRTAIE